MDNLLGKQIANLRKRNNMTQAELAEKLSISYQAISQWEHCNTYPDITMLPMLAKIFNVSIDYLFNISPTNNKDNIIFKNEVKDDTLYVVVTKGNQVIQRQELEKVLDSHRTSTQYLDQNGKTVVSVVYDNITFEIIGEVLNVDCCFPLKCHDINGNVVANGSIHCNNINGNATCSENIYCMDVNGLHNKMKKLSQ